VNQEELPPAELTEVDRPAPIDPGQLKGGEPRTNGVPAGRGEVLGPRGSGFLGKQEPGEEHQCSVESHALKPRHRAASGHGRRALVAGSTDLEAPMTLELGTADIHPIDPGPGRPHLEPTQELLHPIRVPLTVRLDPTVLEVAHPP